MLTCVHWSIRILTVLKSKFVEFFFQSILNKSGEDGVEKGVKAVTNLRCAVLLRFICVLTSVCLPEPGFAKRTGERTLACLLLLPKIRHVKSSQQRNTAHETHIMLFLKTSQDKHDFFSPLQILPQNQPPALVSFCRGKKSRTRGCSHGERVFSSGKRKEAGVTANTLPASQRTNQSQTNNGNNMTRVWSDHLQSTSASAAQLRLFPHRRVLLVAFVGQAISRCQIPIWIPHETERELLSELVLECCNVCWEEFLGLRTDDRSLSVLGNVKNSTKGKFGR